MALKTKQRYSTAVHEAAHAVIAYWNGFPIRSVSIQPTKKRRGNLVHGDMEEWAARMVNQRKAKEAAGSFIVSCLAGFYAECRLNGGEADIGGASDDIAMAMEVVRHIYPEKSAERSAFISAQHDTVKRLMDSDDVWSAVLAVARQLMKCGVLNGTSATKLIASILRRRD